MAGVVGAHGPDEFYRLIGQLQQAVRALQTQQQQTITDSQGRAIINVGLVPGSNPARFGLQFLDPTSGSEIAFMGESSGSATLALKLASGGTVEIDNGGSFTMKSAAGQIVLYAGQTSIPDGSGRTQMSFFLARDDGSGALQLTDNGTVLNHPHQQALQWYDRTGDTVISDDTVSGFGIARPHLNMATLLDTNSANWPGTTSTSWTTIMDGYIEIQHPKISWGMYTESDAATTGEFRLLIDNQQTGATVTVAANSIATWTDSQPWPVAETFGHLAYVVVQAAVTSGTGKVRARQLYLNGTQS